MFSVYRLPLTRAVRGMPTIVAKKDSLPELLCNASVLTMAFAFFVTKIRIPARGSAG
jgi:hypothetical protein